MLKKFLEAANGMEMVEWAIAGVGLAAALATAWPPLAAAVTVLVGIITASL